MSGHYPVPACAYSSSPSIHPVPTLLREPSCHARRNIYLQFFLQGGGQLIQIVPAPKFSRAANLFTTEPELRSSVFLEILKAPSGGQTVRQRTDLLFRTRFLQAVQQEGHGDRAAEVDVPDGAVRQLADLLLRSLLSQAVQPLRHAQPGSSIGPMSANTSPGPGFSGWALPPR